MTAYKLACFTLGAGLAAWLLVTRNDLELTPAAIRAKREARQGIRDIEEYLTGKTMP